MKQWIYRILLLIFCGTCACFCVFRIYPIEFSHETYMGILATLMGVAATFIVGFQIYNSIVNREEINNLREHNKELSEKYIKLIEQNAALSAELNEKIIVLNADMLFNESNNENSFDAFVQMHNSFLFSLEYESPNNEYIFDRLKVFIDKISQKTIGEFTGPDKKDIATNSKWYKRTYSDVLENELLVEIKNTERKIRLHKNFYRICIRYDGIMNNFYSHMKMLF